MFAEIELLLHTALRLSPNSIKDIAAATGIKPGTLYKWCTTDGHLSPKKMEALLTYFTEQEPFTMLWAEIATAVLIKYIEAILSYYI